MFGWIQTIVIGLMKSVFGFTASGGRSTASGPITMYSAAAAPTPATAGMIYYDTGMNKLYVYNGAAWEQISSAIV